MVISREACARRSMQGFIGRAELAIVDGRRQRGRDRQARRMSEPKTWESGTPRNSAAAWMSAVDASLTASEAVSASAHWSMARMSGGRLSAGQKPSQLMYPQALVGLADECFLGAAEP